MRIKNQVTGVVCSLCLFIAVIAIAQTGYAHAASNVVEVCGIPATAENVDDVLGDGRGSEVSSVP